MKTLLLDQGQQIKLKQQITYTVVTVFRRCNFYFCFNLWRATDKLIAPCKSGLTPAFEYETRQVLPKTGYCE